MNSPWSYLEELPTLSAAALEWQQHLEVKSFKALCAAMYLQKANRAASSLACAHNAGCAHRLIRRGKSFVGKCKNEDGIGCEDIFLSDEDAMVFELNLARLGQAVAVALKFSASDGLVGLERTRQIGFAGGEPTPVLLTIQGDEKDFCEFYHKALFETENIKNHGYLKPSSDEFGAIFRRCLSFLYPTFAEGTSPSALTALWVGLYQ